MIIEHCYQFNLALEHGPYAFPGGYPFYFIMSDGEALSFEAAKENASLIRDAIIAKGQSGWRAVAMEINWEDTDLYCAHSNVQIQSAYGND